MAAVSDTMGTHTPAQERMKRLLAEKIARENRVALVVNTKSRRGQATYREAKKLLEQHGIDVAAAFPVRDPSRMPGIVAECVDAGYTLVVVGGGDGSISAVTDSFANKPVVFGLLPLGTANSFARTLGLPLDLAGAIDVIANGKIVDVDLGCIDGHTFANAAAIGLQPMIARTVPHRLKKIAGRIGYLAVAAAVVTRLKPFVCTITLEDGRIERFPEALEVRIANGGYKGGTLIAREASVESGDLVVHVVKGRTAARLAKVWAQVYIGIAPSLDTIAVMRGTKFRIETDPVHYVSIDGEAVAQTPIDVSVVKQALRIMASRDRTDLI